MRFAFVAVLVLLASPTFAAEGLFPPCGAIGGSNSSSNNTSGGGNTANSSSAASISSTAGTLQCQAGATLRCTCIGSSCSWVPIGQSCNSSGLIRETTPLPPLPSQSQPQSR